MTHAHYTSLIEYLQCLYGNIVYKCVPKAYGKSIIYLLVKWIPVICHTNNNNNNSFLIIEGKDLLRPMKVRTRNCHAEHGPHHQVILYSKKRVSYHSP